jgi:TolB-like protein
VERCLQTDPSNRYASAVEILQDLSTVPVESTRVIERPVSVYQKITALLAVILIAMAAMAAIAPVPGLITASKSVPNPRVIVLPLKNLGGPENEPYCRAASDLLAAKLSQLSSIHLISSRSLDQVKQDQWSGEFLKSMFRADYALEGTLQGSGAHLKVTLKLLDVGSGAYLWTRNFTGTTTEVSSHLSQAALAVAQSAAPGRNNQYAPLPPQPPVGLLARDEWLKGHFAGIEYWNKQLPATFNDAERRLKRAIELEPGYVDAIVDLAQLYLSGAYPPTADQDKRLNQAEELSSSVVQRDPNNGRAHAIPAA